MPSTKVAAVTLDRDELTNYLCAVVYHRGQEHDPGDCYQRESFSSSARKWIDSFGDGTVIDAEGVAAVMCEQIQHGTTLYAMVDGKLAPKGPACRQWDEHVAQATTDIADFGSKKSKAKPAKADADEAAQLVKV